MWLTRILILRDMVPSLRSGHIHYVCSIPLSGIWCFNNARLQMTLSRHSLKDRFVARVWIIATTMALTVLDVP